MLYKILILILLIIIIVYLNNVINKKETFSLPNDNVSVNLDVYDKPVVLNPTNKNMKNIVKSGGINYNTKDYDEVSQIGNDDLSYYYNDVINQSNINEDAYDVINQVDKIDYSNVITGLDKCLKNCSGTCFELGYAGITTCYPIPTQTFDWGTLYKNPTFTYGYNAYNPTSVNK